MKTIIISIFMAMMAIAAQAQQKSFYDFTVKTIDGEDISLSTFKGKKVLVVNVASKCGFTPQYAKLEELYEKYGKDNFVIIGFPANNFLSQEPGSNEEIKEFCTSEPSLYFAGGRSSTLLYTKGFDLKYFLTFVFRNSILVL